MFSGLFSDPNMFSKLAANPRTAKYMSDPAFMQRVCVSCYHLLQTSDLTSYCTLALADSAKSPVGIEVRHFPKLDARAR